MYDLVYFELILCIHVAEETSGLIQKNYMARIAHRHRHSHAASDVKFEDVVGKAEHAGIPKT